MLLRSPQAAELAGLLTAQGATVTRQDDGALAVTGLDAAAIGDHQLRRMIQRACARAGFVPRVVARATKFGVLLGLVASVAGVTLVPALVARRLPPQVWLQVRLQVRLLGPAEPVTRPITRSPPGRRPQACGPRRPRRPGPEAGGPPADSAAAAA